MTRLNRLIAAALLSGAAVVVAALPPTLAVGSDEHAPPSPSIRAGDEGVTDPRLISRVPPVYPEEAREAELEATTILQLVILEDGTVGTEGRSCLRCDVKRVGGKAEAVLHGWCRDFCDASLAAVTRWLYEPAEKDGEPVAVYFTVVVDYVLERQEK